MPCNIIGWSNDSESVIINFYIRFSGKSLAGVCRAAFRTDAYIIDSGIGSGIEKFCLRKSKFFDS